MRLSCLRSRGRPAALLLALCASFSACGEQAPEARPLARVFLIGVDGLEWSVLHPLLAEGRCPHLLSLMRRGSFGSLATFVPTWSPVIWTSIATGKTMKQHGITSFVDKAGREFTSARRHGRALWNIADSYGLTSDVFGWWITWPVEPIQGLMVSATSASSMIDKNWKPALMEGLADQVWPTDLEPRVMDVARAVGSKQAVMDLAREQIFGELPVDAMSAGEHDLVSQTLWSIQSDATYAELAVDLLPDHPADLNMIYFGGTDVAGHRFWRQMHPEAYQWQGSSPQVDAALADVIPNYYVWIDEQIGRLLEAVGDDAAVIVVSDHGMHEVSLNKPNARLTTGDHQDGAPGVIIAAGPGIAQQGGVDRYLKNGYLSPLGSVLDVAPTVLGLLGIPPARDMAGRISATLLTQQTRERAKALGQVESHDEGFRPASLVEVPADKQADFVQRMAELGYMDAIQSAPEDSHLVNPETFRPDPEAAAAGSGDGH